MKILIVSATATENHFANGLDFKVGLPVKVKEPSNHDIDFLITGVGAVPTAFSLTRIAEQYQLVINIGIAGSFKLEFPNGTVVCVREDTFGDYGVDDRGTFKSLSEMKFLAKGSLANDDIFANPWINEKFSNLETPLVKGITLSTASGSNERINKIMDRWNADIETMESASVFYVCRMLGVKFICFRAISNRVEPRDKSKWEIEKAISNLDVEVRKFISNLT